MTNWQFTFTGNWPAGVVLAVGTIAAVLTWLFYRWKRAQLSRRVFAAVVALRVLAVIAVALFLLKPVIRFTETRTERKQVIVLQDVSESMGIRDGAQGKNRLETGLALLREAPYDVLGRLGKTHAVRFFSFGAFTSEIAQGDRLQPDQKGTAIGDALKDTVSRVGRQSLSAVILLTDGISTTGEDSRKVAQSLGVPVFPVALGARMVERGKFHDIGIAGVPHNLDLTVNTKATLKVKLSNFGLQDFADGDRQAPLTLKRGDATLATKPIQFPRANGTQETEIEFTPKETGIRKLTLTLPPVAGETVLENNSRDFTVRVIDPKIRALFVEGAPRVESNWVRRVLESDPSVDLTTIVKTQKDRFLHQGVDPGIQLSRGLPSSKEDYAKFNVILLGDIARDEFADPQLEGLKEFVAGGGGLLVMGGYHAYGAGGYAGSPLEDVLPVTMGGKSDGQAEASFAPALTDAGRSHQVFESCAGFFSEGARRMTLDGVNRVKGAKPGAMVLAVHPTERAGADWMPVVAAQRYGRGNVLAFTGDTTWKWKFQFEGRGMDSPYYRFWRQSIRWLSGRAEPPPKEGELLSAWSNKIEYPQGETVLLSAKVRDRQGQPRDDAVVEGQIQLPMTSGKEPGKAEKPKESVASFAFDAIPLSQGEYHGSFRPPQAGAYKAVVKASDKSGPIGQVEVEFVVGQVVGEFDRVDVDELTLRALAGETGGSFHTVADAARIPDELEKRRQRITSRRELTLWNAPAFFLAVLCCVTAEWVLRKRYGLN